MTSRASSTTTVTSTVGEITGTYPTCGWLAEVTVQVRSSQVTEASGDDTEEDEQPTGRWQRADLPPVANADADARGSSTE